MKNLKIRISENADIIIMSRIKLDIMMNLKPH
jgi:hypothetical protein